ncbi:hypothetical protein QAD02_005002, partial [Eretmocerus hayati]
MDKSGVGGSHFTRGEHTLKVPMSLFAENRRRLIDRLRSNPKLQQRFANGSKTSSFVLLQGGDEVPFNDTDISWPFRQESFFQWCFGVEEPGCFGALDLGSGTSILFFPRLPDEYATWMGKLSSLEEFRKRYEVDETRYVDEIASVLQSKNASLLLTLKGVNSDSGLTSVEATFPGIKKFEVDDEILYPDICE